MRNKILSLTLVVIMLLTFNFNVSAQETNKSSVLPMVELTKYIKNTSISLSNEQMNIVFEDIKKQILSKYDGIYKFENFSVEFVNEDIGSDKIAIDVNVDVDMILLRHPADSPYVKGMQTALSNIDSEQEKEIAQNEIKAFLAEVEPYYNTPSLSAFLYRIEFTKSVVNQGVELKLLNNDIQYNLFYRADILAEETILTPVESSEKIDESYAKENGNKAINDAINKKIYLDGMARYVVVTYNRIAARDYAWAHAFDVPEFSAANGMGSDCANFVSKALNTGGIPVNQVGNWYPSPQAGSYAGFNWMRTGYNNNGGVVPYMVGKGYFYKQTDQSQVFAGSILYRTDTSHVALVTYGDGTIIKYTEHSNVKVSNKDIIYSGSNANFYMPSDSILP